MPPSCKTDTQVEMISFREGVFLCLLISPKRVTFFLHSRCYVQKRERASRRYRPDRFPSSQAERRRDSGYHAALERFSLRRLRPGGAGKGCKTSKTIEKDRMNIRSRIKWIALTTRSGSPLSEQKSLLRQGRPRKRYASQPGARFIGSDHSIGQPPVFFAWEKLFKSMLLKTCQVLFVNF